MKCFKNTYYLLLSIVILTSQWTEAFAQKLPKIQKSSVRAPQSLKIDGKTTEWNDQFQAFNWGNYMYYTLSNDDNNLYLTVRMDDIWGNRKVFKGGLAFTIMPSSKKTDKVSITFPVISEKRSGAMESGEGGPLFLYGKLKLNAIANKEKIDSLVSSSNNLISNNYKEINITGIPEISDQSISIYNTQGILVGARFDKKMRYVYELAIPLKYLEAAISDVKTFKYNIKLRASPIIKVEKSVQSSTTSRTLMNLRYVGPGSLDDQFLYNDTDFSGEYTLAKKPQ